MMKKLPFYLNDSLVPFYRVVLVLAFLLSFSSMLVGAGFTIVTYISSELSFSASLYQGFILFLKGAALSALLGFTGFLAFWKRHQIMYENCQDSHKQSDCNKIGFFTFA